MRTSLVVASLLAFVALSAHGATEAVLHAHGYGPVQVGMSVTRAAKVLGIPLVVSEGEEVNRECYHVHPKTGPRALQFMVQRGRIVRVSLYKGARTIRTDRGIQIGSSIASVRSAYLKSVTGTETWLDDEEHEYLGPVGRYLTWWDEKRQFGIRYETDTAGKVNTIHAGGKAITLVEGCS